MGGVGELPDSSRIVDCFSAGSHWDLWGKWGRTGEFRYPLAAHLLDTSAAAAALIDLWFPTYRWRQLEALAGVSSESTSLRKTLLSAAALHDIGKATPVFQGQLLSPVRADFEGHRTSLSQCGFTFPPQQNYSREEQTYLSRHEVAAVPLLLGRLDLFTDEPATALHVLAGHHGRWDHLPSEYTADELPAVEDYYDNLLADPEWSVAHTDLRNLMRELVDAQSSDPVGLASLLPILTSLVCLSDWIASSDKSLLHGIPTLQQHKGDMREFVGQRRKYFRDEIPQLLGFPHHPVGNFREVFGFPPDRPAQELLTSNAFRGLTVVAVPTGEGKTEAALGQWLTSAPEGEGVFFALPTMATADAMFARVRDMFALSDNPVFGALTHSRAALNTFYDAPTSDTEVVANTTAESVGLTPGDWLNGRHRALLAPVAVGTVDQVLSSVLRHKLGFFRLFALSGKTVIFDEVHSYDPYMTELLYRLLEWLGHYHVNTILLSATVPRRRLDGYVRAYTRGQGAAVEELPNWGYPSVVQVGNDQLEVHSLPVDPEDERSITFEYQAAPDIAASAVSTIRRLRGEHPQARIAVIVNTVGMAQEVANQVRDLEPILLHARMPYHRRSERTQQVLDAFGKNADEVPRLLIATQIAEQSLDIDVDVLITEICPATSLVQRTGRLWRHASRSRPTSLTTRMCVLLVPDPLPTGMYDFLPYTAAEIHATWERALVAGSRTSLAVPSEVQSFVDDAEVTFADLETDLSSLASGHVVDEAVKVNRAHDAMIPSPAEINRNLESIRELTRGALDNEERQTRWASTVSAVILPVSSENAEAWTGEIPVKPSNEDVIALLQYCIPVSGKIAGLVRALADSTGKVRENVWRHRLLHDLLVVSLDDVTELDLDRFLGLTHGEGMRDA